jgi:transposase
MAFRESCVRGPGGASALACRGELACDPVRVADGEPRDELQVDFGRMGLVFDPAVGHNRVTDALIFTAYYSRYQFVWLSHRQTTEAVIEGFEAAWAFFEGVSATVIPDNMSSIVEDPDALEPRLNQAFVEYQATR